MNLRKKEASAHLCEVYRLPYAPRTLDNLACQGTGPPYYKVSGRRLYPLDLLDAWAKEKLGPLRAVPIEPVEEEQQPDIACPMVNPDL